MGYDISADIRNDSGPSFETEKGEKAFLSVFIAFPFLAFVQLIFWLLPKPNFLWQPVNDFCVEIGDYKYGSYVNIFDTCSSHWLSFSSYEDGWVNILLIWAFSSFASYHLIVNPIYKIKNKRHQKYQQQIKDDLIRNFHNAESNTKQIDSLFLFIYDADKNKAIKQYTDFIHSNRYSDSYQRSSYYAQRLPDLYPGHLFSNQQLRSYYLENYEITTDLYSDIFPKNHTFDSLDQLNWFNSLNEKEKNLFIEKKDLVSLRNIKFKRDNLDQYFTDSELLKQKEAFDELVKNNEQKIYDYEQTRYLGYPNFIFTSQQFQDIVKEKPWYYLMFEPILKSVTFSQIKNNSVSDLQKPALYRELFYNTYNPALNSFGKDLNSRNSNPENFDFSSITEDQFYLLSESYKYDPYLFDDYLSNNPTYDWKEIDKKLGKIWGENAIDQITKQYSLCSSPEEIFSYKDIRPFGWILRRPLSYFVSEYYQEKYKSFTEEKEKFKSVFEYSIYKKSKY